MAWARLEDGYFGHPKIVRIWDRNPAAVGLHARMITYCSKYETDGFVSQNAVEMLSRVEKDREQQIAALLAEKALHEHEDGFVVNDYLDYNYSHEQLEERREKDRERKRGRQ